MTKRIFTGAIILFPDTMSTGLISRSTATGSRGTPCNIPPRQDSSRVAHFHAKAPWDCLWMDGAKSRVFRHEHSRVASRPKPGTRRILDCPDPTYIRANRAPYEFTLSYPTKHPRNAHQAFKKLPTCIRFYFKD